MKQILWYHSRSFCSKPYKVGILKHTVYCISICTMPCKIGSLTVY